MKCSKNPVINVVKNGPDSLFPIPPRLWQNSDDLKEKTSSISSDDNMSLHKAGYELGEELKIEDHMLLIQWHKKEPCFPGLHASM